MSEESPPEKGELLAQIRRLIDAEDETGARGLRSVEDLPSSEELQRRDDAQTLGLKKTYATNLFWLMVAQLVLADAVFVAYAWAGEHWAVPTPAIQAWLGATVVQIIGIVYVVTRHLFPNRDAS